MSDIPIRCDHGVNFNERDCLDCDLVWEREMLAVSRHRAEQAEKHIADIERQIAKRNARRGWTPGGGA